MELKKSFPKLNDELLKKVERTLAEKFDYKNIPSDYKNFLALVKFLWINFAKKEWTL
ncbi:hypothetical protein [Capnocytophaga canis]|uniref:hypothetical protein n=1 Tax=Capnocytophaga canis TaxID=1848903 RepID=UPI0037D953C4